MSSGRENFAEVMIEIGIQNNDRELHLDDMKANGAANRDYIKQIRDNIADKLI
ncbi:predicted protein [Arabidopsis lyrata subsp. lyrata]|uniref:Predicted protein n=1 Tax=Arabidopsis lyrata subsp. lyrata TaxID=81972 RepID=D7MI56_ARALL|nr:predicted protein [Arabidopsis lyrata subsp. lyrata]